MQDLLSRLDRWLTQHRPDVHDALGPPAGDDDIARLLAGLRSSGFPEDTALPAELEAFLRWHTGLRTGCSHGATWFFGRRDPMRIDQMIESHQILLSHAQEASGTQPGYYHPAWIGFLRNSYSVLCVDAIGTLGHEPGQIVFVDFKGGTSRELVAPSLHAWLHLFLTVLEHPDGGRYYRETDSADPDALWDLTYDIERALLPSLCVGYPIRRTVFDPAG